MPVLVLMTMPSIIIIFIVYILELSILYEVCINLHEILERLMITCCIHSVENTPTSHRQEPSTTRATIARNNRTLPVPYARGNSARPHRAFLVATIVILHNHHDVLEVQNHTPSTIVFASRDK